nr:alpha/beta fold hydrolase [Pseudoalteromonas sp. MMG007]
MRLFCFPYAGGSATAFVPWVRHLPKDVEVVLLQPPGRGSRFSEVAHEDMLSLTSEILAEQNFITEVPYVFFGHSLGSRVAFEVARELQYRRLLAPLHFIASGSRAPHLAEKLESIHNLSDWEFAKKLEDLNGTPKEILHNKELMQLVLPSLRADFRIAESHVAKPEPLSCPITVFYGIEDDAVTIEKVNAWQELSKFTINTIAFKGGHFFINEAKNQVLTTLTDILVSANQEIKNQTALIS